MKNLRKARINKDLTRIQLSELIKCSVYMIDSLESGRTEGSIETLNKLADALNISTDYLLGR